MTQKKQVVPLSATDLGDLLTPNVSDLPDAQVAELSKDDLILRGLAQSGAHYVAAVNMIDESLVNSIQDYEASRKLIDEYRIITTKIKEQVGQIEAQHRDFLALQVAQHQLLLTFSPEFALKAKFKKFVEQSDVESQEVASRCKTSSADGTDDDSILVLTLSEFRHSRKRFHLRQEKLNRWNEERVSGLV